MISFISLNKGRLSLAASSIPVKLGVSSNFPILSITNILGSSSIKISISLHSSALIQSINKSLNVASVPNIFCNGVSNSLGMLSIPIADVAPFLAAIKVIVPHIILALDNTLVIADKPPGAAVDRPDSPLDAIPDKGLLSPSPPLRIDLFTFFFIIFLPYFLDFAII